MKMTPAAKRLKSYIVEIILYLQRMEEAINCCRRGSIMQMAELHQIDLRLSHLPFQQVRNIYMNLYDRLDTDSLEKILPLFWEADRKMTELFSTVTGIKNDLNNTDQQTLTKMRERVRQNDYGS